eukprot:TRINITY_DN49_c0_g3_i1.p1 TRINITY_DN49_c0_g3~~TRINITY_DN49_c0_g3_i1.p1  ORF type:complete len:4381 (+),score=1638.83 TRINITY_DN49_c0_g3_i1:70-13143(+)
MNANVSVSDGLLTFPNSNWVSFVEGDGSQDSIVRVTGNRTAINQFLSTIVYRNNPNFMGSDAIVITVSDNGFTGLGGELRDTHTVAVIVNAVNDGPVLTAPSAASVNEDTDLTVTGEYLSVTDVDAYVSGMRLNITAPRGQVTLASTTGLTFTVGDGSGDSEIRAQGTITALNMALNGSVYRGQPNLNGLDTVTIAVDDIDGAGSGGTKSDTKTIAVTVVAVNDAPVLSGAPSSLAVSEDTDLTVSGISLSDADIGTSSMSVNVTVSFGVMTLGTTEGLTFAQGTGSADSIMRFTGNLTNVNNAIGSMVYRSQLHFTGAANMHVAASDLGVTGLGGAQTTSVDVPIDVQTVNDAPVLSGPSPATVNEETDLVLGAISVTDVDAYASNILQVNVTAVGGIATLADTHGLTFTIGNGAQDWTMSFTGNLTNINKALAAVVYRGGDGFEGAGGIVVSVNDSQSTGNGSPLTATLSVAVTVLGINDAPALPTLAPKSVAEDTNLPITDLSITDVDAFAFPIMMDLTVTSGTLTLAQTTGLTFSSGDGTADAFINATGSMADLNAALNGMVYLGNLHYVGVDTLQVNVNDLGNSGLGGALTANTSVLINVTTANDAPTITAPATFNVNEDTVGTLTVSVSDVDVGSDQLLVRLTVGQGNVSVSTSTGLTFVQGTGFGGSVQEFTGTLTNVNSALTNLAYIGHLDYNGADTLAVRVDDQGSNGAGGAQVATHNVAINVIAVNDGPEIAAPLGYNMTEDTNLVLTGFDVSDVDIADKSVFFEIIATSGVISLKQTTGLVFSFGDGTADPHQRFTASITNTRAAVAEVTYTPNANFDGTETLFVQTNDFGFNGIGGAQGRTRNIPINVIKVNDPPSITVPVTQNTPEDTDLTIVGGAISLSDPDTSSLPFMLNLTVSNGASVSLATTTGMTFYTGDGTNDTRMDILAPLNNLNLGLFAFYVHPDPGFGGTVTVRLDLDDRGTGGAGPSYQINNQFLVNINAVNDAPTLTVPSSTFAVDEDGSVLINGISVADVDVGGASMRFNFTAERGRIVLPITTGYTFSVGDGSAASNQVFTATLSQFNTNMGSGVSFLPDLNYNGPAKLYVDANDQGNVGSPGPLSDSGIISLTVNPTNDAPVLTVPSGTTNVNEDTAVTITGVSIADIDVGSGKMQMNISTMNGGRISLLTINGLTFAVGDGTDDTEMRFEAVGIGFLDGAIAGGIVYQGAPNYHGPDVVNISVSDMGNTGNVALFDSGILSIQVNSINDGPTLWVPGAQSVLEDTDLVIAGMNTSDVDSGTDLVQLELRVTSGVLSLGTATGLNFLIGGPTVNSHIQAQGTITNVNNAIASVTYRGDSNFNGADTLSVSVSDRGFSGTGGVLHANATVPITVTSVNDQPVFLSAPALQSTNEDEPIIGFTGWSVSDEDLSQGADIKVNVTVANGVLTLANVTLVTFTSGNGTADAFSEFTGSLTAVNLALATASYVPNANYFGTDTITVILDDQSGVGPDTSTSVSQIIVNSVLDNLVVTTAPTQYVNEDTDIKLTGITVSSVDLGSNDVLVNLTATGGVITLAQTTGLTFIVGNGIADANVRFTANVTWANAAMNNMTYRGNQHWFGTEVMSVWVSDQGYNGNRTDVTRVQVISVASINDGPTISISQTTGTVAEDTDMTIATLSVSDVDVEGNTMRFNLTTVNGGLLSLGSATGLTFSVGGQANSPNMVFTATRSAFNTALGTAGLVYRPANNFVGVEDILLEVNDQGNVGTGGALLDNKMISVTVVAGNDAPTVAVPSSATTNEDVSANIAGISVSDVDAGTGALNVNISVSNGVLSLASVDGITFTLGNGTTDISMRFAGNLTAINNALSTVTYLPNTNFDGTDSLSIRVYDNGNTGAGPAQYSNVGVTTINVNGVNDGPTMSAVSAQSVDEDTDLTISGVTVADVDIGAASMQLNMSVYNGGLSLVSTTGLVFSEGTGSSDASFVAVGTITNINGALANVVYRGNANFFGTDNITMTVSDLGNSGSGGALTAGQVVAVTVNAVNDAPVLTVPGAQNVNEDVDLTVTGVSVADLDAFNNEFTANVTVSSGTLSIVNSFGGVNVVGATEIQITGNLTAVNNALSNIVYRGNAGYSGSDLMSVGVSDGTLSDAGTIALTVAGVNDGPTVTVPTSLNANEDADLTVTGISVNDTDAGATELRISLSVAQGNLWLSSVTGLTFSSGTGANDAFLDVRGTVTALNNALNNMVYRANTNYNGADNLVIGLTDMGNVGSGGELTANATVSITVNPVNDAPTITSPASLNVNEDTDLTIVGSVTVADVDIGAGMMTVNATALQGTVVFVANGLNQYSGSITAVNNALAALVYRGTQHYNGPDTLTFAVSDGTLSDSSTTSMTVNARNDQIVLDIPSAQFVNEDTDLIVARINVTDVDQGANQLQVDLGVTSGTLRLVSSTGLNWLTGDGVNPSTPLSFRATITAVNAALQGVVYRGNNDYNGGDTLTVTVNDLGAGGAPAVTSATAGIGINVAAVNDVPVPSNGTASVDEDKYVAIQLNGTDIDSSVVTLSATIMRLPVVGRLYQTADGVTLGAQITAANTSVSHSGRYVIYVPNGGSQDNMFDTFGFAVTDSQGDVSSVPGEMRVWVAGLVSGPGFASIVLRDPTNDDAIYDSGDIVRICFNESTNQPAIGNKAAVDALFSFTTNLGSAYSGTWLNASCLDLTVSNAAMDGLLLGNTTVQVIGNLRNAASTSLQSRDVAVIGGSYGEGAGPAIVSAIMVDPTNNDDVRGVGDQLVITFDEATNQPAVASKADIDTLLMIGGGPLASNYTGSWVNNRTLQITLTDLSGTSTPQLGLMNVTVLAAGGLKDAAETSLPSVSQMLIVGGNFGTYRPLVVYVEVPGARLLHLHLNMPSKFEPVANKAQVDAFVEFANGVQNILTNFTGYNGTWVNSTLLELTTAEVVTNVVPPGSVVAPGLPDGPRIALVEVIGDGTDGIHGVGDKIRISFDKETNTPTASSKPDIDTLFAFTNAIGADYSGVWVNGSVLELTITSMSGVSSLDIDLSKLNISIAGPIRTSDGFSSEALGSVSPAAVGTWGTLAGPNMTQAVFKDRTNNNAVFDTNDYIELTFDMDTNQPLMGSKAAVDSFFTFSQRIGADYVGVWSSPRVLEIQLRSVANTDVPTLQPASVSPDLALREQSPGSRGLRQTITALSVQLIGDIRNAAVNSVPGTGSLFVGGNFGTLAGPCVTALVAVDPDNKDNKFGDNDVIRLYFTGATNQPPVSTKSLIDGMMTFSHPIASDYGGRWVNASVLDIELKDTAGVSSGPPLEGLTVTLVSGLRNAAETSLVSSCTSPVLGGNWGTFVPGPAPIPLCPDSYWVIIGIAWALMVVAEIVVWYRANKRKRVLAAMHDHKTLGMDKLTPVAMGSHFGPIDDSDSDSDSDGENNSRSTGHAVLKPNKDPSKLAMEAQTLLEDRAQFLRREKMLFALIYLFAILGAVFMSLCTLWWIVVLVGFEVIVFTFIYYWSFKRKRVVAVEEMITKPEKSGVEVEPTVGGERKQSEANKWVEADRLELSSSDDSDSEEEEKKPPQPKLPALNPLLPSIEAIRRARPKQSQSNPELPMVPNLPSLSGGWSEEDEEGLTPAALAALNASKNIKTQGKVTVPSMQRLMRSGTNPNLRQSPFAKGEKTRSSPMKGSVPDANFALGMDIRPPSDGDSDGSSSDDSDNEGVPKLPTIPNLDLRSGSSTSSPGRRSNMSSASPTSLRGAGKLPALPKGMRGAFKGKMKGVMMPLPKPPGKLSLNTGSMPGLPPGPVGTHDRSTEETMEVKEPSGGQLDQSLLPTLPGEFAGSSGHDPRMDEYLLELMKEDYEEQEDLAVTMLEQDIVDGVYPDYQPGVAGVDGEELLPTVTPAAELEQEIVDGEYDGKISVASSAAAGMEARPRPTGFKKEEYKEEEVNEVQIESSASAPVLGGRGRNGATPGPLRNLRNRRLDSIRSARTRAGSSGQMGFMKFGGSSANLTGASRRAESKRRITAAESKWIGLLETVDLQTASERKENNPRLNISSRLRRLVSTAVMRSAIKSSKGEKDVVQIVRNTYDGKSNADLFESSSSSNSNAVQRLPDFVYDTMRVEFGTKKATETELWKLITAVTAMRKDNDEIDLFASFLEESLTLDELVFFLYVRTVVLNTFTGLKVPLNEGLGLPEYVCMKRVAAVVKRVLGFQDASGQYEFLKHVMDKSVGIKAEEVSMSVYYPAGKDSEWIASQNEMEPQNRRVPLVAFYRMMLNEYRSIQQRHRDRLTQIFDQIDDNGDGELQLDEFEEVCRAIDTNMPQDKIEAMYDEGTNGGTLIMDFEQYEKVTTKRLLREMILAEVKKMNMDSARNFNE